MRLTSAVNGLTSGSADLPPGVLSCYSRESGDQDKLRGQAVIM
jgi:hypothetical protein